MVYMYYSRVHFVYMYVATLKLHFSLPSDDIPSIAILVDATHGLNVFVLNILHVAVIDNLLIPQV